MKKEETKINEIIKFIEDFKLLIDTIGGDAIIRQSNEYLIEIVSLMGRYLKKMGHLSRIESVEYRAGTTESFKLFNEYKSIVFPRYVSISSIMTDDYSDTALMNIEKDGGKEIAIGFAFTMLNNVIASVKIIEGNKKLKKRRYC